jgi:hypothetical protein
MSTFGSFVHHPRLSVVGVIVILLLAFVLTRTLPADAEFAFFGSSFAERLVEVKNDAVTQIPQNLHTHTWSSFHGTVPDGAYVEDVVLVLTWTEASTHEDAVQAEVVLPTLGDAQFVSENSESDTGSSSDFVHVEATSLTEVDSIELESSESSSSNETESIVTEEIPYPTTNSEVGTDASSEVPPQSNEPVHMLKEIEATEEESGASTVETGILEAAFLRVVPGKTYTLATLIDAEEISAETELETTAVSNSPINEVTETFVVAEDNPIETIEVEQENSEQPTEEDSQRDKVQVGDVEGVSTTSNAMQENEEPAGMETPPALYPLRESASVQYSFDGDSWVELGTINLLLSTEAQLSLGVQPVDSIESMHVRVVYLAPQDVPPITFGNAQVTLAYTPVFVEPFLLGPSDQEPNFDVSTIKEEVTSGNIRAVLLERGGVLEYWYGVTRGSSDEVMWRRLVGGGGIDEGTPIGIKARTVFWLDKNEQTLFGFSVDSESLIGVPSLSPGSLTFELPFQDTNDRDWVAVYDGTSNSLTFERYNTSLR